MANEFIEKDGAEILYEDQEEVRPSCLTVFGLCRPMTRRRRCQLSSIKAIGLSPVSRGHGRSSQTADGHDIDHYADDLAVLEHSRSEDQEGAIDDLSVGLRGYLEYMIERPSKMRFAGLNARATDRNI
jgi:hypothetical protein